MTLSIRRMLGDWKQVSDFTTVIPASIEPDDVELREIDNQWPMYPPNFRTIECLLQRSNQFYMTQSLSTNHDPIPLLVFGVGHHKDSGAFTILLHDDVGGLEVKRKTDGDVIQVWSNDNYESIEHRVMVNPQRERFSIPLFFNGTHSVMVSPIDELMTSHRNQVKYMCLQLGKVSYYQKPR